MKRGRMVAGIWIVAMICAMAGGCASSSKHHNSSVVTFLYPKEKAPVVAPMVPTLSLPLKVGIAFVPETGGRHHNLTERDKMELMREVSSYFKKYEFVKSIEIIPSAYLTPKGSFANLDQLKTMFGVDVIALISYDQTQFTAEGLASISYWTLIGAYIVPGEKNDTHTMVDAAVYDIPSRQMLFRAPGTSLIKSRATPVKLSEQLRQDGLEGFRQASRHLIAHLDEQLQLFREKVKASPEAYRVAHKQGYTGSGSLDKIFILLFAGLGGLRLWMARRNRS